MDQNLHQDIVLEVTLQGGASTKHLEVSAKRTLKDCCSLNLLNFLVTITVWK